MDASTTQNKTTQTYPFKENVVKPFWVQIFLPAATTMFIKSGLSQSAQKKKSLVLAREFSCESGAFDLMR